MAMKKSFEDFWKSNKDVLTIPKLEAKHIFDSGYNKGFDIAKDYGLESMLNLLKTQLQR